VDGTNVLSGTVRDCQVVGTKMGVLEQGIVMPTRNSVAMPKFYLGMVVCLTRECVWD